MSDGTKDEIIKCNVSGCDWEDTREQWHVHTRDKHRTPTTEQRRIAELTSALEAANRQLGEVRKDLGYLLMAKDDALALQKRKITEMEIALSWMNKARELEAALGESRSKADWKKVPLFHCDDCGFHSSYEHTDDNCVTRLKRALGESRRKVEILEKAHPHPKVG